MTEAIAGIHHVTAIATDPQSNLDFYTGFLGLRLVKKTVNFDDPGTYHLYYGDGLGRPGTIMTFFPWPMARRGSRGAGQATVTSFSVPAGSLDYWRDRLAQHGVVAQAPASRFGETAISFYDPDGLQLEVVAHADAAGDPWRGGTVPFDYAIRGFHSVTLAVQETARTAALLTQTMGLRFRDTSGNRSRYQSTGDAIGRRVDLLDSRDTGFGRIAAGSVHHVAWRVPDETAQEGWREKLAEVGLHPTAILDRQYFKSIYFREPGGVLFEFATDPPGFTWDEDEGELGAALRLPPWLEPRRDEIEPALPKLTAPRVAVAGEA